MATCSNCGKNLERRKCEHCLSQSAKAQPHLKSPGGFRLFGAGIVGVAFASLLVAGVASSSTLSPESALKQAKEATDQAKTATYDVVLSIRVSGGLGSKSMSFNGSGAAKFATHQSSMVIDTAQTYVEEVRDRSTLYLRTKPNGSWSSIGTANLGLSGITGSSNYSPNEILSNNSSWKNARETGSATVSDHACTTYEIPVPNSVIESAIDKELGSKGQGLGGQFVKSLLKNTHLSDEIAVDDSTHVMRQVTVSVSMSLLGQNLNEKITMTLDHFGEPVSIEIPSSAKPIDQLPNLF